MPAALAPPVYSEALSVPPAAARYTPGREFRPASPSATPEMVLERHLSVPLPMPVSAHHAPVVTSTLGLSQRIRHLSAQGTAGWHKCALYSLFSPHWTTVARCHFWTSWPLTARRARVTCRFDAAVPQLPVDAAAVVAYGTLRNPTRGIRALHTVDALPENPSRAWLVRRGNCDGAYLTRAPRTPDSVAPVSGAHEVSK
jgi:hypothetical protein